jgi:hypothetical protein
MGKRDMIDCMVDIVSVSPSSSSSSDSSSDTDSTSSSHNSSSCSASSFDVSPVTKTELSLGADAASLMPGRQRLYAATTIFIFYR